MNNSGLKIVIIILLSLVVGGLSVYFYNEYKKRQMVKAIAEGLAEGLKEMNKEFENAEDDFEYTPSSTESVELKDVNNQVKTDQIEEGLKLDIEDVQPISNKNLKRATCQIDLTGRTVYKGGCNFESSTGGSFAISNFDTATGRIDSLQEIFVEIESQGQATVYGMDRTHSIKPWGSAKRSTKQKACWIGELDINEEGLEPLDDYSFKVCAW